MELTGDPLIIGVQIAVTGLAVVFTALTVVALALGALRRIDGMLTARRARSRMKPQDALRPEGGEAPAAQLDPVLIAVLVAAAAETLNQPVRITRVRYYDQQPAGVWSRQGRLAIMAARQRRR